MTHEELLPLVRELAQQHGESLTLTAVQRQIGISRARLLKLCGSWSQLRSAIGLSPDGPHARNQLSNESIQDKLRAEIAQSMSRADNCYDNAFAESGFGTLKTELEMTRYDHVPAARREIGDYLAYYNLERKHSSLGYLSPHQFELHQAGPTTGRI